MCNDCTQPGKHILTIARFGIVLCEIGVKGETKPFIQQSTARPTLEDISFPSFPLSLSFLHSPPGPIQFATAMSMSTSTTDRFAALQPDSTKPAVERLDPSKDRWSRPPNDMLLPGERWEAGKSFDEMTRDEKSKLIETTAASMLRMSGMDHAIALMNDKEYWYQCAEEGTAQVTASFRGTGTNTSAFAFVLADEDRFIIIDMVSPEGILATYATYNTNALTRLTIRSNKEPHETIFRRSRDNGGPEVTECSTTGAKSDFVFLPDSYACTDQESGPLPAEVVQTLMLLAEVSRS